MRGFGAVVPPLLSKIWRRIARFRPLVAGLFVATLAAAVYLASSRRELLDPKFSLLAGEALLVAGSLDLAPYLPHLAAASGDDPAAADQVRLPYQLRVADGRLLYIYPPGNIWFAVPPLALARLAGWTSLTPDGRYSSVLERRLHALFAALIAAATVVAVHRLALRELPLVPATVVAFAAAFGSELWGTASRLVWSNTWVAFWLALAWLELVRWEDGERRRPWLLAATLGAAVWCRLTASLIALPLTLYVAWRHRPALLRLLAGGGLAAAVLVAYDVLVWGSWAPSYEPVDQEGGERPILHVPAHSSRIFVKLGAQLFSAEHGLLVLSPVLLLALWALARHRLTPERRPLGALAGVVIAAHLVLYSLRTRYWGGGVAGNRMLADLVPLLAWLGAHAWRRWREACARRPRAAARRAAMGGVLALLLLASVAAHAAGSIRLRWPRTDRARRAAPELAAARDAGPQPFWLRTPQAKLVVWLAREWWPARRSAPDDEPSG